MYAHVKGLAVDPQVVVEFNEEGVRLFRYVVHVRFSTMVVSGNKYLLLVRR